MADNRSIVITLKLDNSDDNDANVSNQVDTSNKKNDKDKANKAVALYAAQQISSLVTSEVLNWAEYYWNRELTLNDDYIGQRNKTIITTQINRGINFVSSLFSGMASGMAIGGAVGAVIGLLISGTSQAASIVRSNQQGQDQQNIMIRQMNAGLDFTRSRAGWSLQAASIGEDL